MSGMAAPRPYQSRASTTFSRPGHGNEHALVPVIGLGPTGFRWPAHFWAVPSFAYKSCSPNPSVVSSRPPRRRTVATRASNDRRKKTNVSPRARREGRRRRELSPFLVIFRSADMKPLVLAHPLVWPRLFCAAWIHSARRTGMISRLRQSSACATSARPLCLGHRAPRYAYSSLCLGIVMLPSFIMVK